MSAIPIPTWDGLHPIIIHFPIGLLLVAPVLVVLSVVFRTHGRAFAWSALLLMVLGTVAAHVAVATGEAAAELALRGGPMEAALEKHESLAELTRTLFTVLTLVYAAILLVPVFVRATLKPLPLAIVNGAFLVFYLAGSLFLVNTGHEGGRLVHEFGVQALMEPAPSGDQHLASHGEHDGEDHEADHD